MRVEELEFAKQVFRAYNGCFIRRDLEGGAWKAVNSVANLGSKTTRLGTYNENLTVRIGD
jgi:Novel toxin 21